MIARAAKVFLALLTLMATLSASVADSAKGMLAAGRIDAFIACAGYLRGQGLSAPEILAADPAAGLAVLEDLGDDLYARLIEQAVAGFVENKTDLSKVSRN